MRPANFPARTNARRIAAEKRTGIANPKIVPPQQARAIRTKKSRIGKGKIV